MIAAVYARKSIAAMLSTVLALAVLFTGCSTYAASRYAINAETVAALRTYRPSTVSVGPFTATKPGQTEITCRAVGPIKTPDSETFEDFIVGEIHRPAIGLGGEAIDGVVEFLQDEDETLLLDALLAVG